MLLAIDAGNTNIVFAVYDGFKQLGHWRISTEVRRTADEYAVWLTALMSMRKLRPIDVTHAILSSVVPAATFNLIKLCRDYFGADPMRVGDPVVKLGIVNTLPNPREAGADRLVNSVSAAASYPAPLIVVDIGTGTTFDIVDAEGNYCGGVIAPGPQLALDALHRVAAQLPKVEIVRPETVIGRGTVPAMQSGMFWGYTSMIEGLILRLKAELSPSGDPKVTVVTTGGLGTVFAQATTVIDHIDPELTLRGLVRIFQLNQA